MEPTFTTVCDLEWISRFQSQLQGRTRGTAELAKRQATNFISNIVAWYSKQIVCVTSYLLYLHAKESTHPPYVGLPGVRIKAGHRLLGCVSGQIRRSPDYPDPPSKRPPFTSWIVQLFVYKTWQSYLHQCHHLTSPSPYKLIMLI